MNKDEDKRLAFRIDDSLPVLIRKIDNLEIFQFPELGCEELEELSRLASQEGGINPYLCKMLVAVHKKLDWIMEKLPVDLLNVKAQPINLSATGMRIQVNNKYEPEEKIRIKILLPTLPISEVIIDGMIARVNLLEDGRYDLAIEFKELEEEVREELIQHSLKQQRKTLLAQRQQRGKDESTNG